jgi:hypothetical protein
MRPHGQADRLWVQQAAAMPMYLGLVLSAGLYTVLLLARTPASSALLHALLLSGNVACISQSRMFCFAHIDRPAPLWPLTAFDRINAKLGELSIDPDALLPAGWRPLILSVGVTVRVTGRTGDSRYLMPYSSCLVANTPC